MEAKFEFEQEAGSEHFERWLEDPTGHRFGAYYAYVERPAGPDAKEDK